MTFVPQALRKLGVVSGADMTVEAALTKLSYLLGREDLDVEAVREVSRGKDLASLLYRELSVYLCCSTWEEI